MALPIRPGDAAGTTDLLASGLIWQADRLARPVQPGWSTGFAQLDAELPGGGWPRGALIELIGAQPGSGELQLLLPMLRQAPADRWNAWIAPPWLPHAAALAVAGVRLATLLLVRPHTPAELVWSLRQALASGACHAVLAWCDRVDQAALRRLQLAAEDSTSPLFLHRPLSALRQASPAALRLQLVPRRDGLGVVIVKRRGPPATHPLNLPVTPALRPASGYPEDGCIAHPGISQPLQPLQPLQHSHP